MNTKSPSGEKMHLTLSVRKTRTNMTIDPQPIRISGVILAAGASSRMGRPKQLLPFNGTTLLGQVIENARRSDLDDIVVVLGHQAQKIQEQIDFRGITVLVNLDYASGQSSSVKAGIDHAAKRSDAAMILLGDQPLVDPVVINRLIQSFKETLPSIVVPVYNGRRGNPVIIIRALFNELKSCLVGDSGARILFSKYSDKIRRVDVGTRHIHFDVDVMDDYRRLLKLAP